MKHYQQQFDAIVDAMMSDEWGKCTLLLIELKAHFHDHTEAFSGFLIALRHGEFLEEQFSFSEAELKNFNDITKSFEDYLREHVDF